MRQALKNFLILVLCASPGAAFAVTGSITDPGFASAQEEKQEQEQEEEIAGPLRGSLKTRFSRHIRRSHWKDFLSGEHRDSFFHGLLITTDLSLNYPLAKAVPFFKDKPGFDKAVLFLVLSYRRPIYDTRDVIKHYCFKSYFCFGETSVGLSRSLPPAKLLTGGYSVYLNIPATSKQSLDSKKILGAGASLSVNYHLLSRAAFKISALSSHFFDTAVYGSRHADKHGSSSNDIFSVFNQAGLKFSPSSKSSASKSSASKSSALKSLIPIAVAYISHAAALDYRTDWFQRMSVGLSAVWSVGKKTQIAAGFGWGGAVFRHEHTAYAKDAKPFNPDETRINGGFIYSF